MSPIERVLDLLEVQAWTADAEGNLTFVNAFGAHYLGRSSAHLVGEGWQDVLHAADVPIAVERWTAAVRSGEPYGVDFRLRRHGDQLYRWHRATARRIDIAGGRFWYGTNVDVDAEHRRDEPFAATHQQRPGM